MNTLGNPIKSQNIENNENNPNSAIKAKYDPKESEILDEKALLVEKLSLLPSDKNDILSYIQKSLQNINMQKITIENLSSFICDKIYKYRNLIIEDLFQLIDENNQRYPKVEHLCLINDIIFRNFGIDKTEKEFNNILTLIKKKLFPYIKGICSDLFFGLDRYFQEAVMFYINEWEKNKYFDGDYIKEIKFELKMRNDPEITGKKQDITFLKNFVNCGGLRIEQGIIDFAKQYDALDRNKDNKQRKNMLKMEREIIHKQIKMYLIHIQRLKEINLLINKIKEHHELFDNKH